MACFGRHYYCWILAGKPRQIETLRTTYELYRFRYSQSVCCIEVNLYLLWSWCSFLQAAISAAAAAATGDITTAFFDDSASCQQDSDTSLSQPTAALQECVLNWCQFCLFCLFFWACIWCFLEFLILSIGFQCNNYDIFRVMSRWYICYLLFAARCSWRQLCLRVLWPVKVFSNFKIYVILDTLIQQICFPVI